MIKDAVLHANRPKGEIAFIIGNECESQTNTFTDYGISQLYQPGDTQIFNDTTGGIFKWLHLGNGTTPITSSSTQLESPIGLSPSDDITNATVEYITLDGIRYAKQVLTFDLGVITAQISEIMLSEVSSNDGMLCGKLLDNPIVVNNESLKIVYSITMPIVSSIQVLTSGQILDHNSQPLDYEIEGRFHEEQVGILRSKFPVQSEQTSSGNLSRFYVNNNLINAGTGFYKCDVIATANSIQYEVTSAALMSSGNLNIINSDFGPAATTLLNQNNYVLRLVFDSFLTKSASLNFSITFRFTINFV